VSDAEGNRQKRRERKLNGNQLFNCPVNTPPIHIGGACCVFGPEKDSHSPSWLVIAPTIVGRAYPVCRQGAATLTPLSHIWSVTVIQENRKLDNRRGDLLSSCCLTCTESPLSFLPFRSNQTTYNPPASLPLRIKLRDPVC
jgi:hypothetical protein